MQSVTETSTIINKALQSFIGSFGKSINLQKDAELLTNELYLVFSLKDPFLEKLDKMDEVFDRYPQFKELQEPVFDLLMVRYLSTDTENFEAEYFDSEEWLKIEDDTLDRGTELLNILIYIFEAKEEEVEISVDDFIEEFLLADDESFSEESEIYSLIIDNKDLIEVSPQEWIHLYNETDDDDSMKEFILSLFFIFSGKKPLEEFNQLVTASVKEPALIIAYNNLLSTFTYNE